jgi:glutamate-1-semialdehyde 2,1-aminomutase
MGRMAEPLTNESLYRRGLERIPGGVNSPVRAFRSVGGTPYFVARAEGAHVWDVEGRRFIDYVQSYGASILGHAAPAIVSAVQDAATRGTTYGAPTEGEVRLAEELCARGPASSRSASSPPAPRRRCRRSAWPGVRRAAPAS